MGCSAGAVVKGLVPLSVPADVRGTVMVMVGLDGDPAGVGFHGDVHALRARASPTWIFCPPTMIAPRTDTRRVTISWPGRRGGGPQPKRVHD